ncbi:MAG: CBS domain-containing protein, partial [Pyrinomonadaceae bacterium]
MKVSEAMTENPACCATDTSLQEAARMMAENDCGCIPITDMANKPIGMLTDRDITIRTVAQGKNPLEMIAGEVMTPTVVTITPEMSVEDCCDAMEKNQVRRIAVVDERGAICGMVAQADVANFGSQSQAAKVV